MVQEPQLDENAKLAPGVSLAKRTADAWGKNTKCKRDEDGTRTVR